MSEEKNNPNVVDEPQNDDVIEKPIELNEETIEQVKARIADEVREEAGISAKDSDLFRQMCEEASMPVEYLDKDFKLGDNELDIRSLSKRNYNQMIFRTLVLQNVYLKNTTSGLLDITRLLLVLLDKLGVEDIVKATDDIVDKINEQTELLKNLKKQQNN